ncbi:MAG: DUF1275 domain-containing protein [Pirellulales bacterium]|nr:DUF1275 domain-containing protein [Pirellulales bacterium]
MLLRPDIAPLHMSNKPTLAQLDFRLAAMLSLAAGAVDVIGFLALGGLFTSHITGNLAVVAAHYTTGFFSEVAPMLAIPIFMVVLVCVSLAAHALERRGASPRRFLLVLHTLLLVVSLVLGWVWGPFENANLALPVLIGMLLVAAMAVQNAFVKQCLADAPSTAAMTMNTTQMLVDVATLAARRDSPEMLAKARRRAGAMFTCLVGFVVGCAIGAVLEYRYDLASLAFPTALAIIALPLNEFGSFGHTTND